MRSPPASRAAPGVPAAASRRQISATPIFGANHSMKSIRVFATLCALALLIALPVGAQAPAQSPTTHMPSVALGGGWQLSGMAQAFPIVTFGAPGDAASPLNSTEAYVTQPALMTHLEGPGRRVVLHTTLNFEGLTQPDGELTPGGWGEGFLDKRHPHTLLHEAMLSLNFWRVAGGALSVSAGKGFAPYGTSDPMARPGLKYPTNHHLSQILERWTANAAWMRAGWSLEAGLFGGQEPEGAYDFSNIESFGDSWSVRGARRWSGWEASASFGAVTEFAHTVEETTRLVNVALMRTSTVAGGQLYTLAEASRSYLADHDDFFSVLAEARWSGGGHQPYLRLEWAERPEYAREGATGSDDFFLYEHDDDPIDTSRWFIATAAYAFELTPNPWSVRPFVEGQYHRTAGTGLGSDLWAVSLGARVFLGGDPMRMGSYGALDPTTDVARAMEAGSAVHVH